MSDNGEQSRRVAPLVIGVLVVLAAGIVIAVAAINRDNNSSPLAVVVTPTPVPATAAPTTPDPTPVAAEDTTACAGKSFGQHLSPVGAPSDVHVYSQAPAMTINTAKLYRAAIITPKGTIFVCLEPSLAPKTVNNFVTLARNHFYDGLTFHRVVSGFVIQGGDPAGTGNGGPGYQFADEPVKGQYIEGAVAMANSGPNTNGSQFFIDIADDTQSLQPLYNLFGYVESGMNTALQVAVGDVMTQVLVEEQS